MAGNSGSAWDRLSDKMKAGIGLVVIGGLIAGYAAINHKSNKTGCALTAAGIAIISTELHNHASATQIMAVAALPLICQPIVDTFVSNPSQLTPVTVQNGTQSQTQSLSGNLLLPYVSPPTTSPLLLTCRDWRAQVFVDLCLEGKLGPPVTR